MIRNGTEEKQMSVSRRRRKCKKVRFENVTLLKNTSKRARLYYNHDLLYLCAERKGIYVGWCSNGDIEIFDFARCEDLKNLNYKYNCMLSRLIGV